MSFTSIIGQIKGNERACTLPSLKSAATTVVEDRVTSCVFEAPDGITKGDLLIFVPYVMSPTVIKFNEKAGWKQHQTVIEDNACITAYTKLATGAEGSELAQWTGERAKVVGFYLRLNGIREATVHNLTVSEAAPSTQVVPTASALVRGGLSLSSAGHFDLVIAKA